MKELLMVKKSLLKQTIISLISFSLIFVVNLYSKESDKKEIFNNCKESVVQIKALKMPNFAGNSSIGSGSGYVVSNNGFIITNYHVIDEAEGIVVVIPKEEKPDTIPAYPVWYDDKIDIAVLKMEGSNYKSLQLASSDSVFQGEEILVLGYPQAGRNISSLKVTWGILSSNTNDSTLQTTASINPGNSGGPAINMNGEVVGTVFAKHVSIYVESTGFLRNVKFAHYALDSAINNYKKIDEFYGTKKYAAYNQLALAEANYWQLKDPNIPKDIKIRILNNSIELINNAIETDPDYTLAYYFLASYYLKEALLNCQLYNQDKADSVTKVFMETLEKARSITPLSELIEYNEKIKNRLKTLYKDEELNCKIWRRIVDSFVDYEKDKDKRHEDFQDYLYYGEKPYYLSNALGLEDERTAMGIFLRNYLTLKSNIDNKSFDLNKIEIYYEFDNGIIPMFDFLPAVEYTSNNNEESLYQIGLGYYNTYIKKTFGNSKTSISPDFVLGFYTGLTGKSVYFKGFQYIWEIQYYNKAGSIEDKLGIRVAGNFNVYKFMWISTDFIYYPYGFNQLGFGLGFLF